MAAPKTYSEDVAVAQAMLRRDSQTTIDFMYKKCYPLFKSIYNNYFTDCKGVQEFIDEIYLLVLTPSRSTGRCQLESYRGESTLATWFKAVSLCYCYRCYRRKEKAPEVLVGPVGNDPDDTLCDRSPRTGYTLSLDTTATDRTDLEAVLSTMPNERYRTLIRLRYVEGKSNEETAQQLAMGMANYYSKHKLAKAQFVCALEQEDKK